MTDSRSPHGALTEDVGETLSGKGREGNKEGKGTRVETYIHSVTYVGARAASEPSVEHQPHATAPAWMGMNR